MPFEHIDQPFTVEIKDGIAYLTWPDHKGRAVPLRVFREEHRRAGEALAEYDHGPAQGVVPFPGRRRRRSDPPSS